MAKKLSWHLEPARLQGNDRECFEPVFSESQTVNATADLASAVILSAPF
jgi:hypothetical protein